MNRTDTPTPAAPWRPRPWLLAIACFLTVFGARVAFVDAFGSDLPTWDQWGAEGERLIIPDSEGKLRFIDLFLPHNEHRVVATKLLALGLYRLNGQWDARLQCVVNAAMVAACVAVFYLFGRRLIRPGWELAWLATLLALFAAPMSWQNALGGFHTQQTFLIAFSVLAIAGLTTRRAGSAAWFAGLACGLAALFTMASGLLAVAAAGATLVLTIPLRDLVRRHALTLVACTGVFVLGLSLHVHVPYHDFLKAKSVHDFLLCFWRSLQWPQTAVPVYACLSWLPWVFLTWKVRRDGLAARAPERVIAGAGIWVLLQFAASAYARGADGAWPADRYLDTVALGIALNVLALLVLVQQPQHIGWRRWARTAACVVGISLLAHGWWGHVRTMLRETGPALRAMHLDREHHTGAYIRTGDASWLKEDHIPHPNAHDLKRVLDQPAVREALPASVRNPRELPGHATPEHSFTPAGVPEIYGAFPGWPILGTHGPQGRDTQGRWQSAPLASGRFGYWLIPIISDTSLSHGLEFRIEEPGGSRAIEFRAANDPRLPHPAWDLAATPAPEAGSRIDVRDASSTGWLGWGPPVEMGAGSFWAWRIAQHGFLLFLVGLGATGLVGVGLIAPRASALGVIEAWRQHANALPRRTRIASMSAGALLCAVVAYVASDPRQPAFFVATIRGDLKGNSVELFYDRGHGIRGSDSAQCWFDHDISERYMRLPLPAGTYRRFRFDPMDYGATTIIEAPRIEDADGRVLRELTAPDFTPLNDVVDVRPEGASTVVTAAPGGSDPQLVVHFAPPLPTIPVVRTPWSRWVTIAVITLLGLVSGPALASRLRRRSTLTSNPKLLEKHPV